MKLGSFDAIIAALNAAKVRHLVVGGMAVNAHGYLRFTKDVDLVVRLQIGDIQSAFSALSQLGYKPLVPITVEQFSDPAQRQRWLTERNMIVLQLWSDQHPETPIDLFIHEPFDFDTEYDRALVAQSETGQIERFASLDTLIRMKEETGRDIDRIDARKLRELRDVDLT